jgi:hypothetical protein
MTKVLERTIAISSKTGEQVFPSAVANIEFAKVLNWCNAAGFSAYAEGDLKRYCLWKVTWLVQHRGNLYRNSQLANQLETIALPTEDDSPLSSSAKADDPVSRDASVQNSSFAITGCHSPRRRA